MEEKKHCVTGEEQLFERSKISPEKGKFLSDKCRDLYLSEMEKTKSRKDIVDLLFELRQECSSAGEDMFVCYCIGAIHGHFVSKLREIQETKITLKNIFDL